MKQILRFFLDLCLLRAGPDRMPASTVLLALSLLAYIFSGLMLVIMSMPLIAALGQACVDTLIMIGVVYGALWVYGFRARLTQTVTALAGSGALLNLLATPPVYWISQMPEASQGLPLSSLLLLVLMVWSLLIVSHILHLALESPRGLSMGLALTYFISSVAINDWLFPVVQ
ncbi:MAG TPA: hypothetical protein EYN01_09720 [Chromatiales bacterium]|jgi:hypothetical protein|nr:hypothetical protein [Chromatiales bacterium]